jgi:hypothetical protein
MQNIYCIYSILRSVPGACETKVWCIGIAITSGARRVTNVGVPCRVSCHVRRFQLSRKDGIDDGIEFRICIICHIFQFSLQTRLSVLKPIPAQDHDHDPSKPFALHRSRKTERHPIHNRFVQHREESLVQSTQNERIDSVVACG